jgi:hypothetical protein
MGDANQEKVLKENPLKRLWEAFNALDKFTRMLYVSAVLFILATPVIANNVMSLNQHASEPIAALTAQTDTNSLPTKEEFLKIYAVKRCSSKNDSNFSSCVNAGQSDINFVYNKLKIPLKSSKYKELLINGGHKLIIYIRPLANPSQCGTTSSGAEYSAYPDILQFGGVIDSCLSSTTALYTMVHETGHIIMKRNMDLFNTFPLNTLATSQEKGDPDCYEKGSDGYYLRTYGYRAPRGSSAAHSGGGGARHESFGEAIGLFVACGPDDTCQKYFGASKPIKNFAKTCPNTYAWVKHNIFGDYDFYAKAQTSCSDRGPAANQCTTGATPVCCQYTWAERNGTCTFACHDSSINQSLCSPACATPPTISLPPPTSTTQSLIDTADTWVRVDQSTVNYGSSATMRVDGDPVTLIYLKFDLSSLKGKTIEKAVLNFTVANLPDAQAGYKNSSLNLNDVTDTSWSENTLTFNNKPAWSEQPIATTTQKFHQGDHSQIDITSYVQQKAGSLSSIALNTSSSDGLILNSKEASSDKPTLEITYH